MSLVFAPFAIVNDIGALYPGEVKVLAICENQVSKLAKQLARAEQRENRRAGRCVIVLLLLPAFNSTCIPPSTVDSFIETQLERNYSRFDSICKEQLIYALYKISYIFFPPPRTSYIHAHHGEHFPSQRLHAKMHLPRRTIPSSTDQFSRRRTPSLP